MQHMTDDSDEKTFVMYAPIQALSEGGYSGHIAEARAFGVSKFLNLTL